MSKENTVSPVPTSPVATQKLVANIGHDITEYDSVNFEAPANATPEDIRRLAEQAVRDFVENDEEAFADSELGETNGLRITGIMMTSKEDSPSCTLKAYPWNPTTSKSGAPYRMELNAWNKGYTRKTSSSWKRCMPCTKTILTRKTIC